VSATAIAASTQSSAAAFGGRSFDCKARFSRLAVVNAKNVRRLMREHELNPRRRGRFVRTADNDHDGQIRPFLAKDFGFNGRDQFWVADLTYVAIVAGFAYVALMIDAWSRRAVGCAIGRRIDARLAVEASRRAIMLRRPPPWRMLRSDRGSRYASEPHGSGPTVER
jgi:putative transposase